jgi:hypothetical protein
MSSVFERVGLPAVQGKCMTDLYVTCSTEACAAGCTEDLYVRGNEPILDYKTIQRQNILFKGHFFWHTCHGTSHDGNGPLLYVCSKVTTHTAAITVVEPWQQRAAFIDAVEYCSAVDLSLSRPMMATSGLRCCTLCLSIHYKSLFEVGHRDTGTQLKYAVLSVSTFILNLY